MSAATDRKLMEVTIDVDALAERQPSLGAPMTATDLLLEHRHLARNVARDYFLPGRARA